MHVHVSVWSDDGSGRNRARDVAAGVTLDARLLEEAPRPVLAAAILAYEHGALRASNPHARLARTLTWADSPAFSPRESERWAALRQHVLELLAGTIADPRRGRAAHFGSRTLAVDVERANRAVESGRWRRLPAMRGEKQSYFATVRR